VRKRAARVHRVHRVKAPTSTAPAPLAARRAALLAADASQLVRAHRCCVVCVRDELAQALAGAPAQWKLPRTGALHNVELTTLPYLPGGVGVRRCVTVCARRASDDGARAVSVGSTCT
jgi:hypothetical protein